MSTPVVSASRRPEKLSEAPATMLVITRKDLELRGYRELSELLDDLPGMDLARPYGDTYVKAYWRGFRNTIGDPFLLLVDGLVFNHLYYNTTETALVPFPMTSLERVEVLYGPASAVYGSSAFMGVINLITQKESVVDGTQGRVNVSVGPQGSRIADATVFLQSPSFRMRVSTRLDDGNVDSDAAETYEWTRRTYLQDPRLWSQVVLQNPRLGPLDPSAHHNRALDVSLYRGDSSIGFTYLRLASGYGFEYATDQSQANGAWVREEWSASGRFEAKPWNGASSSTVLRWRRSTVRDDSFDVSGFFNPSQGTYVNRFSRWGNQSDAASVIQDIHFTLFPSLDGSSGLKLEVKDLQRVFSRTLPADFFPITEPLPIPPPLPAPSPDDMIRTWDRSIYAMVRYQPTPWQQFHAGLRHDHNSVFGGATTLRLGYVGSFGAWTLKALHGQAFQEPNPRALYSGFERSGHNPNLKPERSRTTEASAAWASDVTSQMLSLYRIRNTDTVTGIANLGRRDIVGLDYQGQWLLSIPSLQRTRLWIFATHLVQAEGTPLNDDGLDAGGRQIGDLAQTKVWCGLTAQVNHHFDATLRGRYASHRSLVATNPLGSMPSSYTLDLAANLRFSGVIVTLGVNNLLNARIFQPGIRQADAGDTPGHFVVLNGLKHWSGSGGSLDSARGYYNSLLPQPGRQVSMTLKMTF